MRLRAQRTSGVTSNRTRLHRARNDWLLHFDDCYE